MITVEREFDGKKFYYNRFNSPDNPWDEKLSQETMYSDECVDLCEYIAGRFGGKVVKAEVYLREHYNEKLER